MNIENLKQIKLLMEYDTSLTKDENLDKIKSFMPYIISEQRGFPTALSGLAGGVIDDILKKTTLQTVDNVVIGTADDLQKAVARFKTLGKPPFTPQMLGTLRSGLLKSPNVSLASKSASIDDLIKGKSFLSRYANSSYDDIVKGMKGKGNAFPDDVAEEIAKRHTKGSSGTVGGAGKNTVTNTKNTQNVVNNKSIQKSISKNSKKTAQRNAVANKKAQNLKNNPKFISRWDKVKNLKWGEISKWALGLGIAGAVIWYFMSDSGDPLPEDFPTTPPVDEGGGGSNTGGGAGGTKYTSCPETFPISQNCKNNKIKEIQACLSMPAKYQTGNFGTITQGYLERAGVSGTEITQDSYDKVCNKTTTSSTPFEDDEDEDTDLNQTSTTSTTTSTTSTDDVEEA